MDNNKKLSQLVVLHQAKRSRSRITIKLAQIILMSLQILKKLQNQFIEILHQLSLINCKKNIKKKKRTFKDTLKKQMDRLIRLFQQTKDNVQAGFLHLFVLTDLKLRTEKTKERNKMGKKFSFYSLWFVSKIKRKQTSLSEYKV